MKIRFSIQYRTEWGQQLAILITYRQQDGAERTANIPMLTEDGESWTAETSVLASRRSPIESFTYLYIVEDNSGHELRREWSLVPRVFAFDSTKIYTMADHWRDLPLHSHVYKAPYQLSQGEIFLETVRAKVFSLFRKTVMFRVSAPQLSTSQQLAIIGSHPALGAWNPARFLPMESIGMGDWMTTLNVDWIGMPLEYKYVVVDKAKHELVAWEEGDNRQITEELGDGEVYVTYDEPLRMAERTWRVAGVAVPVFALRSEHSCGVGDFGDLKRLVDWASETGMRAIQLLPVNDTTVRGEWGDSCPYCIVSAFALHPHYLDLEALGTLKDKKRMTDYRRQQRELNALSYSDYEAVHRVKMGYVSELFQEQGEKTLSTKEYTEWEKENEEWLAALDKYHESLSQEVTPMLSRFIQYHLHCQLKSVTDYAHSKGIFLKGDLTIGVCKESADGVEHPEYFHLDMLAGSPPDTFSMQGQVWGFPTYNWQTDNGQYQERDSALHASGGKDIYEWYRSRIQYMAQYFDAIRIDHVLGYFSIWEVPCEQLFGIMGHYSPALPFTRGDIEYFGLPFRRDMLTRPFINDRIIDRIFGMHAKYVRENFLTRKAYGLYDLNEEVSTQRKVKELFEGKGDENSLWIRDGLYRLVANVLFVEDPHQPDSYHPRVLAYKEPVFEALTEDERDAYMRLYNNFFLQRHSFFWGRNGYELLNRLFGDTRMLVCAEDLGAMPECVEPVLDSLHILTLEVQTMPKQSGIEFTHLDANPIRSVATISTHDMSPLRLWWEENPERTQRFYTTMLQKQGRAPEHLPAHLAEEIIARHLYSPSMMCILSLQDWLAMDSELWNKNPREERINIPGSDYHRWQWRMHLNIEELLKAEKYNKKIKMMVSRSKRA